MTPPGQARHTRAAGSSGTHSTKARRPWFQWHQRRAAAQFGIDSLVWVVGLTFATLARYDFHTRSLDEAGLAAMVPLALVCQLAAGVAFGLYLGRHRFGSFDEVAALARTVGLATVVLFLANLALEPRPVPRAAALAAGFTALVLMAAVRYLWRLRLEQRIRPSEANATPLLVFGAGEGGAQVITAMLRDPRSPYFPVGLLDDDPAKRKLRISGVAVVGDRHQLAEQAGRLGAEAVLIAIPSADAHLIADLTKLAGEADLAVKVLPPVRDLFGTGPGVGDIRDLDMKDFLGRHQVETDVEAVAGYLTGKRVLVTGAGGSIGSELCRQISRFGPAELVMLDCSEAGLHAVQLSLDGRALMESEDLVLADIRDAGTVRRVFASRRPEVVFHAAALKHLPLLQRAPGEAVRTNVWGTLAVLEAATEAGVERFVNISTDKAADPANVLGYSKRIAERLTAHFASESGAAFMSVRFGNVLGSSGSVLKTFQAQLEGGGPLTVTDPKVSRYFMTVEEAVELVIQAGAIGGPGETLVLDMGEPVLITDVAERLVSQSDRPVRIVFTGLRAGEKLHESRLGGHERDHRPKHPMISHVAVPSLDPEQVGALDPRRPVDILIEDLGDVCLSRTSFSEDRRVSAMHHVDLSDPLPEAHR